MGKRRLTSQDKRVREQNKRKTPQGREEFARKHMAPRRVLQYRGSRLPLNMRAGQMTRKAYREYLKTPHWKEFSERYRASTLLQECFVCGASKFELHHITYTRLYKERLEDVVPLCDNHHRHAHRLVRQENKPLAKAHLYVKARYDEGRLEMKVYKRM